MTPPHLDAPLPTFPERFNLCDDFLDRDVREGRGDGVAILCGEETRTIAQISTRARR